MSYSHDDAPSSYIITGEETVDLMCYNPLVKKDASCYLFGLLVRLL
jgi:hypothetical protein